MGVIIRHATEADALAIACVRVDSWRATYSGLIEQSILDALSYEEQTAAWSKPALPGMARIVAEGSEDGKIVGFSSFGVARADQWGATGMLYALYLLPSAQGAGVGYRLFSEAASWLGIHGHERMAIRVLRGNKKAIRFYERVGAVCVGEAAVEIDGYMYDDLVYVFELR